MRSRGAKGEDKGEQRVRPTGADGGSGRSKGASQVTQATK